MTAAQATSEQPDAAPAAGAAATPSAADLRRVIDAQRLLACSPTDPETIFSLLAETAQALLGADGALAAQLAGDVLVARATVGASTPPLGTVIPVAGTLGGLAVTTRQAQLCHDGWDDPRTDPDINRRTDTRSSVMVPLIHEDAAIGLVAAVSQRPGAFDENDTELLSMLAKVAAHRLVLALTRQDSERLRSQSEAALDAMTEGLLTHDLSGAVVFANESAQRILGIQLDRMHGRGSAESTWRIVREDGSDFAPESHPQLVALATGEPQRDQVMGVHTPDNGLRWLRVNVVPMRDAEGVMTGVVSSFADITEQRAVTEALRESERRLSASQRLVGLGTWRVNLRTDEITWSPEMYQLLGLRPDTFHPTRDTHRALIHPDDYTRLVQMGEDVTRTRLPQQMVVRIMHADGGYRLHWNQCDVALDSAGQVEHLWGTAQDITGREQFAEALAASEQHFRVAFDNAPIGMSMIGLVGETRGHYLRANDAFCRMLGYEAHEIPLLSLASLTHVDDVERDTELFQRILDGETRSVAFEKRFRHRDGRTVFAWLTSAVAQDAQGEPLYLISHALDVTERRKEQAELERLALTDTLTGLANRTLLNDRLDQALARLHRESSCAALLMLDVDRFKLVNDSLGHQVGDALLVEVASRIEAVTRADATVARLGGDEFVVLAEGLRSPSEAHAVAVRLLKVLRQPYVLSPGTDSIVATVSIGISVAESADRTPSDLYREADLALYRAKDAGRDQYALFDDALRAKAVARLESESLLRRAVTEDLLVPLYQPIIDLADGRIVAMEVLARIKDPDRGIVVPEHFIDVAEETGLIVEVDARMFELAVGQFARWSNAEGLSVRRITVNVSARSLEDPSFVDRLRRALSWYGVAGASIRIELTERSLLTTNPAVRDSLCRIGELGMAVGLDDFGTGYSALAYLQRFHLQFLKIDRSFVSRLGQSLRDDAVVGAVIDLAHAHELLVIGEGVETTVQLDRLRAMGCDRAQGYLMGRPMAPDLVEELVRSEPCW
ncbi:MAG: EAL domain-containing protein [Sporichthyaceae bacterium]